MTPREQAETIIDVVTLGAMHDETIRALEAAIQIRQERRRGTMATEHAAMALDDALAALGVEIPQ